jgi:hypothetical protein
MHKSIKTSLGSPKDVQEKSSITSVQFVRRNCGYGGDDLTETKVNVLDSLPRGGEELFLHRLNDPMCEALAWRTGL